MNLVGKIFTVLIFVMSVAFMVLSVTVYATHRNWRETAQDLQQDFETERRTNEALRAELENSKNQLAAEQIARRHALANLQTRVQVFQEQLQQREQALANLQAVAGKQADDLQAAEQRLADLTNEVAALRADLRTAIQARDEQFQQVVRLTDERNQLQTTLANLQERQAELASQASRMRNVLAVHGLDEHMTLDNMPPFAVDGVVNAVRQNLVDISLGSDDGLREGHTLEVYRNNTYLGRVVVVQTYPDRSVARILPEFRQGDVRRGDRVATKLS